MKFADAKERVITFLLRQKNFEALRSKVLSLAFRHGLNKIELDSLEDTLSVQGIIEVIKKRENRGLRLGTYNSVLWRLK